MVVADLDQVRKDYGRLEERLPGFVGAGQSHRGVGPVTLRLARGDSLAVVGENGAGKSTLLRLMGGLACPTSGRIEHHGRFGRLLELGGGFLEDCTGRENGRITLAIGATDNTDNAAALAQAFEFSGLGAFLDQPVRTYSMGMRLRLAYALVVAESPDVLVVDEVLAVGDEAFQRQCMAYMEAFLSSGSTLVLATHNLYVAEKVCSRGLWLEAGRVKALGPVSEVVQAYRGALQEKVRDRRLRPGARFRADAPARLDSKPEEPTQGGAWTVCVSWPNETRGRLEIRSASDALVTTLGVRGPGRFEVARCPLLPGRYRLLLFADGDTGACAEGELRIRGAARELGVVLLEHGWREQDEGRSDCGG